jgi:hypothetical protein
MKSKKKSFFSIGVISISSKLKGFPRLTDSRAPWNKGEQFDYQNKLFMFFVGMHVAIFMFFENSLFFLLLKSTK